jgi:hypothetical protein
LGKARKSILGGLFILPISIIGKSVVKCAREEGIVDTAPRRRGRSRLPQTRLDYLIIDVLGMGYFTHSFPKTVAMNGDKP